MNPDDLWIAQLLARGYRRKNLGVRALNELAYAFLPRLRGTAPEVWLTVVMQLAKG